MDLPQCQICCRPPGKSLAFNCFSCARNAVYLPRLQQAQILIHKEALGKEVEESLNDDTRNEYNAMENENEVSSSVRVVFQRTKAQRNQTNDRTHTIDAHVQALHEEMALMKAEIHQRRTRMSQQKTALTSAKSHLAQQKVATQEPAQKAISKIDVRWNANHEKIAEARIFLCREVANLYGLHQRKRRKGMQGRDIYSIGGVPIVDLRDINTASPSHITVSVNNLAHLLHLTSHYLSVRLPAEITLPSPQNPHTIIFSPSSSYHTPSIPSLSLKSPKSSSTISSRARPLYLERPLLAMSSEDPIAYSLFIDAVTLLAWDVAWLCRTQGLDIGGKSWEEVCAMGRNMWTLLVAVPLPTRPSISRTTTAVSKASADPQVVLNDARAKIAGLSGAANDFSSKEPPPPPGYFSHGTSLHFLAGAEGSDYMRSWKLANPIRFIEKIKGALAVERMGTEWEMLEEAEWEGEGEAEEKKTIVGDEKVVESPKTPGTEFVTNAGDSPRQDEAFDQTKSRNGWMKVKSRGVE